MKNHIYELTYISEIDRQIRGGNEFADNCELVSEEARFKSIDIRTTKDEIKTTEKYCARRHTFVLFSISDNSYASYHTRLSYRDFIFIFLDSQRRKEIEVYTGNP